MIFLALYLATTAGISIESGALAHDFGLTHPEGTSITILMFCLLWFGLTIASDHE